MIIDREALDLPEYLHLLTGHYVKDEEYRSWRQTGTDDWLLIATVAGGGQFGSNSDRLTALPRQIALIRAGTPHDYRAAPGFGGWEILWAHFHPRLHWHDWLAWPEALPGLMTLEFGEEEWPEILDRFRRIHNLAGGVGPHSRDLAMNALEELILTCHGEALQRGSRLDPRIDALLVFINSHLAEEINIPSLAARADLSPSRLSHLFQEQVGIAPMQYLDLQRIERAKQLLIRTTGSVRQIAEEVGLDPIYFSLRFKQHTGLSPRAYRQSKAASQTAAT